MDATLTSLQAVSGYGDASAFMPPRTDAPRPLDAMTQAAEDFTAQLRAAEAEAARAVTGDGDPHTLVTALAESRMAVEATVAVRDRMVEAYQELLRMQV